LSPVASAAATADVTSTTSSVVTILASRSGKNATATFWPVLSCLAAGVNVAAVGLAAVSRRRLAGTRRRCAPAAVACRSADRNDVVTNAPKATKLEDKVFYTSDWDALPKHEDLERWMDGEKEILVKTGKIAHWRKQSDVSSYRYTDTGYESKDENGNWVNYAAMPQDTSHLTDAQRERLVSELRGDIKVSMKDCDDDLQNFRPLPSTPPLEKWPFHEAKVVDEVKGTPDDLKGYRILRMTESLDQAYYLAARWKGSNEARRHLGYNVRDEIEDVANMNASVLALRATTTQLTRLGNFRKMPEDERSLSDSARLRAMRVDGILGTTGGSALALWFYSPAKKRAYIDVCVGDDCMEQGPHAEEVVMKFIFREAGELGAETVWCRTRRTESGRVLVPTYFKKFGFSKLPPEAMEEEMWEDLHPDEVKEEIVEFLQGLSLWMSTRDLAHCLAKTNEWCKEMGAADVNEVADNKEDLADYLGLEGEERERLLKF